MKKILVITSTRPDIIKLFPVIRLLRQTESVQTIHLHTGQHADLADNLFKDLDLQPDLNLHIMKSEQTLNELMSNVMAELTPKLAELRPDITVVQGDTTSALSGALAAFYAGVPVAHVEAGLRSHDLSNPYPEEANRKMISAIAHWHFTPTELATQNLLQEQYDKKHIIQTGNTVVDAVNLVLKSPRPKIETPLPYLLVTLHRREHIGRPLEQICEALLQISQQFTQYQIVLPMHPNPQVREILQTKLASQQFRLIEPVSYPEFLTYLHNCHLVITDSGGVQEEAMVLRKPLVVVRRTTERMEAVAAGYAKLVGVETSDIVATVGDILSDRKLYDSMVARGSLYGDGKSAERIVKTIA